MSWGGFSGYASSQYLTGEGSVTYTAPAYSAPAYTTPVYPRTYAYYDDEPYAYSYGPGVRFYDRGYVEDRRISKDGRFQ
ncbi:MAG: hypothetical protein AB7U38_04655 [Hyphomicrobiales bacterium]